MTSITLRRSATDLAVKLKFASGLPGVPGEASDLQEGSVTTLDASADASFSITGTPPNQILNLSLPRGMTGPVGEGSGGLFFESRAAAASATVGAGINAIRTAGFSAYGDGGHGLYKRLSGHPYPAWSSQNYIRLVDVRNSAGRLYRLTTDPGATASTVEPTHTTGTVTGADGYAWTLFPLPTFYFQSLDGTWWGLVPEGGEVWIEQLGGNAGYVGSGTLGTDNYQPILDGMRFKAWGDLGLPRSRQTYRIRFSSGRYWVSKTIYVYDHTIIEGNTTFQGEQTTLFFPNNVSGFVFHQGNTGPGGDGLGEGGSTPAGELGESQHATLKGLALDFGNGGWITDLTKKAIYARTTINLENVSIFNAPGKGVFFKAYAGAGGDDEGNCNQWNVRGLYVHSSRGDKFHVQGADVNGGAMYGFRTQAGGGCGIRNESYYANHYSGLQITGYGDSGVSYGGKLYVLIDPLQGSTVTPGTDNRVWYYMYTDASTPAPPYPLWSGSDTHLLQLPIYDNGSGSGYYDVYVEVGTAAIFHVLAPSTICSGGLGATLYSSLESSTQNFRSFNEGVGSYVPHRVLSSEAAVNGAYSKVWVGRSNQDVGFQAGGGLSLLSHQRGIDGDLTAAWGYVGNDIEYAYAGEKPFWRQTTPTTTQTLGRNTPQPFTLILQDFGVRDANNTSNVRVMGLRDQDPTNLVGEYSRGERYHHVNPTAGGFEGWICVTNGAVHNTVWSSGVSVNGNTRLKNSANRVYKKPPGGATSTVEPVHTSGTVTGADGIAWTWLADGPPVFKQFGIIAV